MAALPADRRGSDRRVRHSRDPCVSLRSRSFCSQGQAFKRALKSISGARTYVAAMTCAVVERALRTAVDYAVERESFGRPLIDHQGLRWSLVDVAARLEAARLLTLQAAHFVALDLDAQFEAALTQKVFGRDLPPKCNRLHASNGCSGVISAVRIRPSADIGADLSLCRRHNGNAKRTHWGSSSQTLRPRPAQRRLQPAGSAQECAVSVDGD